MAHFGRVRVAAVMIAAAVAGCVTVENALTQNDVASLKLSGVTVSFAPEATIQWDDGIRAYAAAKAVSDDELAVAANSTEGRAFIRSLLGPRVKAGVEKSMAGQLSGARPVRLDIVVHSFVISSAVQRILIGGGHGFTADANLVDARSGAVIVAYPKLTEILLAGRGVLGTAIEASIERAAGSTTLDRLVDGYGAKYRDWLLRRT